MFLHNSNLRPRNVTLKMRNFATKLCAKQFFSFQLETFTLLDEHTNRWLVNESVIGKCQLRQRLLKSLGLTH